MISVILASGMIDREDNINYNVYIFSSGSKGNA